MWKDSDSTTLGLRTKSDQVTPHDFALGAANIPRVPDVARVSDTAVGRPRSEPLTRPPRRAYARPGADFGVGMRDFDDRPAPPAREIGTSSCLEWSVPVTARLSK